MHPCSLPLAGLLFICLTAFAQAQTPVGNIIWLYHDDNGSYVTVDGDLSDQLTARDTARVGPTERFLVEDVGDGNFRLRSTANEKFVRVNTSNVDKLIADSTNPSDPLTHFSWTTVPGGKVRITSVGDDDSARYLSPSGSAQIVRSNRSTTGSESEFTWGIYTERPPNIVMIYIDDWAWNGSSVAMDERMANSHFPNIIEMPNLDAMAANGMVFRNAYGSPQCTPARAAIQTGQSNARNGMTVFMGNSGYFDRDSTTEGRQYYHFPVIANGAESTLRPEATTIPEALAPFGYVSAHIGKWHLRGSPGDEGYILHDGPTTNDEGNNFTNSEGLEGLEDPKLMTYITDTGKAFMEAQVDAEKPFYLQLSHYAVHGGSECTPESRARYQNIPEVVAFNGGKTNPDNINRKNDPAVWLGMVYELDQKIGEIRDKVDELGIADNTYIIVTGDNGYRHSFFDELTGLPQPLHSRKWWAWQGGIRVPQVIEGPDIPKNSFFTPNTANYDFLPTFVEWAGGDPVFIPDLDGVSLAGVLAGETPTEEFINRSLYFHYPHYRNTMPHSAIVKGGHKAIYFYETPVRFPAWDPIMLFDLNNDAGEYHNIYAENSDLGDALYNDLMSYLVAVEARIPEVPNPNYDADVYESDDAFGGRSSQGPFVGTRSTSGDQLGPTPFFNYWMESWGVDLGSEEDDYDGDGASNWMEYTMAGNPTDIRDVGLQPVFSTVDGALNFSFFERNDDSAITYVLESSTTLLPDSWAPVSGPFDSVYGIGEILQRIYTVPIDDSPQVFYRLNVQ
ncbi:MAG: sulfatase-like hydrolase/transferase [Verrucomicrobiota bacterium]